MHKHKSEDFKISAFEYYLTEDVSYVGLKNMMKKVK